MRFPARAPAQALLESNKGQPNLAHRRFRAPFLGISSRPRTTSHIGAAKQAADAK